MASSTCSSPSGASPAAVPLTLLPRASPTHAFRDPKTLPGYPIMVEPPTQLAAPVVSSIAASHLRSISQSHLPNPLPPRPLRPARTRPVSSSLTPIGASVPARPTSPAPPSPLSLVLSCVVCQHTSTWFYPNNTCHLRGESADTLPDLLSSSRSTSSDPSSISTHSCISSTPCPHQPPIRQEVQVWDPLNGHVTHDPQDDLASKAQNGLHAPSPFHVAPPETVWRGGKVLGICSICHFSGQAGPPLRPERSSPELSAHLSPAPRVAQVSALGHSGSCLPPPSDVPTPAVHCPPNSQFTPTPLIAKSAIATQAHRTLHVPGSASSPAQTFITPSHPVAAQDRSLPDLLSQPSVTEVGSSTPSTFQSPGDENMSLPRSPTSTLPSSSALLSPVGRRRRTDQLSSKSCVPPLSPSFKSPSVTAQAEGDRVTKPASLRPSRPVPIFVAQSENFLSEATKLETPRTKNKITATSVLGTISPPLPTEDEAGEKQSAANAGIRPLLRSASYRRGESLRLLLRQAKIPATDNRDIQQPFRSIVSSTEVWEAAMLITPREHLRSANLPSWQSYSSSEVHWETSDAERRRELSRFSSLSSINEAFLSPPGPALTAPAAAHRRASRSWSGSLERSPSQLTSPFTPPSETSPSFDLAQSDLLPGRSSSSRQEHYSDDSPIMCLSPDSDRLDIRQEILQHQPPDEPVLGHRRSGSSQRSGRPNLLARFAQHYHVGGKGESGSRSSKRRPSTATCSSSPAPSFAQSSPKPGGGTPTHSAPAARLPSPISTPGLLYPTLNRPFKSPVPSQRPATATGAPTEPIALSVQSNVGGIRPSTAHPRHGPPLTYTSSQSRYPPLSRRPSLGCSVTDELKLPYSGSPGPSREETARQIVNPVANGVVVATAASAEQFPDRYGLLSLSKSVPNTPLNGRFLKTPKSAAGMASSENLPSQVAARATPEFSKLPPEEFFSKSRSVALSVLPRPSSETLRPGQTITAFVRLGPKVKAKKYTSIVLLLSGVMEASEAEGGLPAPHRFLHMKRPIFPLQADGVQLLPSSHQASAGTEWQIDLTLPQFATCTCRPGPLPLPGSGAYQSGHVKYSLQLVAERKQLLASSESVCIPLHLKTTAEARYQVTTQPLVKKASSSRIDFSGGYLGSIEAQSLCHQVYYQSPDRLRIGYQIDIELSKNSFLPVPIAEDICKSIKIEVRNLIGEVAQQPLQRSTNGRNILSFQDHRSSPTILGDRHGEDQCPKWTIKGYLEFKNVAKQMSNLRDTLDTFAAGATVHPSTSSGAVSGFGKNSRNHRTPTGTQNGQSSLGLIHNNLSQSNVMSGSLNGSRSADVVSISGSMNSLQTESERQAKLNNRQLFIVASFEPSSQGVLSRPIEVSNLIGPDLVSKCCLKRLGEEMMKKVVMEEKMKKVQEAHAKNRKLA